MKALIKTTLVAACVLAANLYFTACNNEAGTPAAEKDAAKTSAAPGSSDSLSQAAELSFMDGCVEMAKANLGEQKAFAYCKCFLEQAKEKYGAADSTVLARLQADSAEVARMALRCK